MRWLAAIECGLWHYATLHGPREGVGDELEGSNTKPCNNGASLKELTSEIAISAAEPSLFR